MTYRGGATLAWQSDYSQFYLMDASNAPLAPPEDITPEIAARRYFVMPSGLVIYTNDCLQQLIEVRLFDGAPPLEPKEWRSGQPWQQIETMTAQFPSRAFTVTSPSGTGLLPGGPRFMTDAVDMRVRVQWREDAAASYDTGPRIPDVIRVELWPAS